MFARFFIERPIFAWVVSIVILLVGGVSAWFLPIAQYPEITPPKEQESQSASARSGQNLARGGILVYS